MPFSADQLLDRMQLKKRLSRWRNVAVVALILLGISIVAKNRNVTEITNDYVASVAIEGIILEDQERIKTLRKLRDDPAVKAVIVRVDSPGGTIVGGESLYKEIRQIAAKKPVVTVMGSIAASGGYMAAMAAHYIFAYEGTLTGSIGVLLQTADITELATKLGINLVTLKTSELKGTPSPLEKMTPAVSKYMQDNINKAGDMFVTMVAEARQIPKEEVQMLADGRIFMGSEAVKVKLVDAIGNEENALEWLKSNGKIDKNLKIQRRDLIPKKEGIEKLFSVFAHQQNYVSQLLVGNMMALWNPGMMNQ
jgi:protease-4